MKIDLTDKVTLALLYAGINDMVHSDKLPKSREDQLLILKSNLNEALANHGIMKIAELDRILYDMEPKEDITWWGEFKQLAEEFDRKSINQKPLSREGELWDQIFDSFVQLYEPDLPNFTREDLVNDLKNHILILNKIAGFLALAMVSIDISPNKP